MTSEGGRPGYVRGRRARGARGADAAGASMTKKVTSAWRAMRSVLVLLALLGTGVTAGCAEFDVKIFNDSGGTAKVWWDGDVMGTLKQGGQLSVGAVDEGNHSVGVSLDSWIGSASGNESTPIHRDCTIIIYWGAIDSGACDRDSPF